MYHSSFPDARKWEPNAKNEYALLFISMWYINQSQLFIIILNNVSEQYITTGELSNHTPTRKSVSSTKKKPTSLR
jgi:hypothetical protein